MRFYDIHPADIHPGDNHPAAITPGDNHPRRQLPQTTITPEDNHPRWLSPQDDKYPAYDTSKYWDLLYETERNSDLDFWQPTSLLYLQIACDLGVDFYKNRKSAQVIFG